MKKITENLNVNGFIYPGSYTSTQIAALNGNASNNGAIIYNGTASRLEVADSGGIFSSIGGNSTVPMIGQLVDGSVLSSTLLPMENIVYRFAIDSAAGITVNVSNGSTIWVYSYHTRQNVSLGVNFPYLHSAYAAYVDIIRTGTNYYLREIAPFKISKYPYVNNTGTDVAINYNTTTVTSIKLSTVLSAFRYDLTHSRINVNTTTGTFTTEYNGHVQFTLNLNFTCKQNNNSIQVAIVNNTTGLSSTLSVVKVLTANGTNISTLDKTYITPCAVGNTFQVTAVRYGTATTAITLSNTAAFQSRITASSYLY